jgi:XTP/dITP diphosphohydrolase
VSADALVLATRNEGKLRELTRILSHQVTGLDAFPGAPDVPETGATFEANALLKARAIAAYTGLPAVADDSGLCVDALNGMPDARLGARFVSAAALVVPADGDAGEWVVTGEVEGRLIRVPRGTGGFGYDPIFVPDGFDLTTAEMTPEAKDAISHRGRAFRALAPFIQGRLT